MGSTAISGSSTSGAEFYSSGEQMRRPKAVKAHLTKQAPNVVSSGRLWVTLWGFLHLIPLAFDVPFLL